MNILFFGDSNTHGSNPAGGARHSRDVRFTGLVQKELGANYYIIEEGLGGRTTVFDDPTSEGRCGIDYIVPCLKSHKPIDLLVIMLGTNDTKAIFSANAHSINMGMQRLVQKVFGVSDCFRDKCNILLVSPCIIKDGVANLGEDSPQKSKDIIPLFEQTAKNMGLYYMAASDFAQASDKDKLHLDADAHRKLAVAFKSKILEIEKTL